MTVTRDDTMPLIMSFQAHLDYRETHDRLHLALDLPGQMTCGPNCCYRHFITLQTCCAAVKIAEREMR